MKKEKALLIYQKGFFLTGDCISIRYIAESRNDSVQEKHF